MAKAPNAKTICLHKQLMNLHTTHSMEYGMHKATQRYLHWNNIIYQHTQSTVSTYCRRYHKSIKKYNDTSTTQ